MNGINISIDVEPDNHTKNKYTGVTKGLILAKKIFNKYDIQPTLFVTGYCLKKYPLLFKKLKKEGWEISCHGYSHKRFDEMSENEKKDEIKKSKILFRKYLNSVPSGFRAPEHSIDKATMRVLKETGFLYDSSYSPWNIHHILFPGIKIKFSNNFIRMKIKKIEGMCEAPMSSFIIPFGSITLRILPKPFLRVLFYFISKYKNPVFLMHSWDFTEMPESKMYRLCPIEKYTERFEYMIKCLSKKRNFCKIEDYFNET